MSTPLMWLLKLIMEVALSLVVWESHHPYFVDICGVPPPLWSAAGQPPLHYVLRAKQNATRSEQHVSQNLGLLAKGRWALPLEGLLGGSEDLREDMWLLSFQNRQRASEKER